MRAARVFHAGRDDPEEISGADVVLVAAEGADEWGERIRVRAPSAVVVVVGGSPQPLCERTLFPRARVIGVDDEAAAQAVTDAVVGDSGLELECVVRCEGERGIEGEFARVPVRIDRRGVGEIGRE